MDATTVARPGGDPRSRRRLGLLLTPIVILSLAGLLADWFAAAILTEHPLLQVFLNPRIRYLTLASNHLDALSFYGVAFLRLVLTDPLFFLFGRWHGDAALRWMERHWPASEALIRWTERAFGLASYVLVAVAPNGVICLLAGATGMSPAAFVVLNVGGTVARLVLIRTLAAAFAQPLEQAFQFVSRFRWWLVGLSVAIGLVQLYRGRRAGRSPVKTVSELEGELEEAGTEGATAAEAPP